MATHKINDGNVQEKIQIKKEKKENNLKSKNILSISIINIVMTGIIVSVETSAVFMLINYRIKEYMKAIIEKRRFISAHFLSHATKI